MPWYIYLARCGDGSLYTGMSTDPERRLQQHNAGKGSKYIHRKGGAVLVYNEPCATKSKARRRERQIQSWDRLKKLALIADTGNRQPLIIKG